MADERLSNVIGAPFPEHVITQLYNRAAHNSTGTGPVPVRSNDEVLFLANKMAWAKVVSSVRIQPSQGRTLTDFYKKLDLGSTYRNPDDLAKSWILEAGTSQASGNGVNIRKGVGLNGAYGLGGTKELGYRPMPGLTSITVDTKGSLGSLREATINFKVWNMNQLNIIEALYFRLGYSMLLEWGHVQYYSNVNRAGRAAGGSFVTNTYGIDPFQNYRKEQLQQLITKRGKETSGNYDAMWGIVSNFTWSFNQEGGYDCVVKLIGLGSIIDSLKINLSYKMPDILFQEYDQQQKTIQEQQEIEKTRAAEQKAKQDRENQGLPPELPALPINPSQIYTNIYKNDLGTPNPPLSEETFLNNNYYYTAYDINERAINNVYDYFYKAQIGGNPANSRFKDELNKTRTGLFLSPITNLRNNWQVIFADNPASVTLSLGQLNLAAIRVISYASDRGANNRFALRDPWTGGAYDDGDLAEALGADKFVKLFDLIIRDSKGSSFAGVVNNSNREVDPDEKVFPNYEFAGDNFAVSFFSALGGFTAANQYINFALSYTGLVRNTAGQTITRTFYVQLSYQPLPFSDGDENVESNRPTRKELTTAVQTWFSTSRKVNITSITPVTLSDGARDIIIRGTAVDISIPNKTAPVFEVLFNNTGLIQTVLPPVAQQAPSTPDPTQEGNSGDVGGRENEATTSQIDQAQRFASSLHAMLSAVKSQLQTKSITVPQSEGVFSDSLLDLTKILFRDGVLDGILTDNQSPAPVDGEPFNLRRYALKGFNSNLMADPSLYNKIEFVNFADLCTAYGIRYKVKDEESSINFPIYIKFGYLLSFLNSMCLIYDSTQDTDKHPYIYLDFNPATNFCLTIPQHLSVDPFICMIPFQGSQDDYLKIFPSALTGSLEAKAAASGTPLFGPQYNAVSSFLNSFKSSTNSYQGRTMEILLNVDFLLQTLNQYTTQDSNNIINLKGFLDAVVSGINKSTGNLNLFRVSYRDDSNTVIIKDDQFVPPAEGEAYMLDRNKYLSSGPRNIPKYGQIPVFGLQSLVREMEFKTNLSTKVSTVVAVSGQSGIGAANSSDYSPFSYLNTDYVDAYKPRVTNSTQNVKVPTADVTGSVANDLNQALQFNTHITSIYYGGEWVSKPRVVTSTNYYINQLADVKSTNGITVAAPTIPANLSITIDGISGIVMGNAFTIPEDRLPLSLRGTDGETKVGFVVVGLTHTIDNNQWLTKIRGQMIRLRDSAEYGAPAAISRIQTALSQVAETSGVGSGTTTGCRTSYPDLAIKETVQVEFYPISKAAAYLKANYPDVGKAAFAVMIAEARTAGDNFRSAGGNNFGGVQTDAGVWGFGNFNGQFCRRDSGGQLRMFASFTSPEAFLDFLANRIRSKKISSTDGNLWTAGYIDRWWSPAGKASFVSGTAVFNSKLSIFNRASRLYDQA
jgi:hypothetical protein